MLGTLAISRTGACILGGFACSLVGAIFFTLVRWLL